MHSSEWLQWTEGVTLDQLYEDIGTAGKFCVIHSEKPM